MHITTRQEQLSKAYIHAVASAAGFSADTPLVDDQSVDLVISGNIVGSKYTSPKLDIQLKAPFKRNLVQGDILSYNIKKKNYDDLRAFTLVPRILVAVMLPDSEEEWVYQTEEELIVRHCGYWTSLKDLEDLPANQKSKNIHFPRENIFNVEALRALMAMVADGGTP